MAEAEPDYKYQSIQYFISEANWSYQDIFAQVSKIASGLFKKKSDTGFILDETSFTKKGKSSVGVARQYLGTTGKIDNGQVGVFGSLCNNTDRVLIDGQLYLPTEWTDDEDRLEYGKVPENERDFKTKDDIALDIIDRAKKNGVSYGWIGGDAGYGKNIGFLHTLDDQGELFVIDVQKKLRVFQKKPVFNVPIYSGRGPIPKKETPSISDVRIDSILNKLTKNDWKKLRVRESTKGFVEYDYNFSKIYLYDEESKKVKSYRLIIRKEAGKEQEYKFTLSNATSRVTEERLAYMQAQRYWVERSFQDAKQSCGMKDYQVRSWMGWHHHMALVSMATLFVQQEKMVTNGTLPLLSCTDITEILTFYLSHKMENEKALLERINVRHKQRQVDILRWRKKKKHPKGKPKVIQKH